jgi:hypothetical protein
MDTLDSRAGHKARTHAVEEAGRASGASYNLVGQGERVPTGTRRTKQPSATVDKHHGLGAVARMSAPEMVYVCPRT